MMTSSNGNIFRVTGPLCGESTGFFLIQNDCFGMLEAAIGQMPYAFT